MNILPFHFSEFQTPAGRFSLAVDGAGAVAATAFGGKAALRDRLKGASLVADPEADRGRAREVARLVQGEAAYVHRGAFARGHALPAEGVGRPAQDTLRRDAVLRRRGPHCRQRAARRRPGQRHESDLPHCSLPPGHRRRRLPHGIRIRRANKAPAPRFRGGLASARPGLPHRPAKAFSLAWSLIPGDDSTPLFTSTKRAPVPARASATLLGIEASGEDPALFGPSFAQLRNFGQSPVRPVPPNSGDRMCRGETHSRGEATPPEGTLPAEFGAARGRPRRRPGSTLRASPGQVVPEMDLEQPKAEFPEGLQRPAGRFHRDRDPLGPGSPGPSPGTGRAKRIAGIGDGN